MTQNTWAYFGGVQNPRSPAQVSDGPQGGLHEVSVRICLVMIASLSVSSCIYRTAQLDVDAPPEVVAREVVSDLDHSHDEGFREKTTRDPDAPILKLNEWPVRDLGRDEEIRGIRSDLGIPEGCSLNRRAAVDSREGDRGYLVDIPLKCEDGRELFTTLEVTREQPHKVYCATGQWLVEREKYYDPPAGQLH